MTEPPGDNVKSSIQSQTDDEQQRVKSSFDNVYMLLRGI